MSGTAGIIESMIQAELDKDQPYVLSHHQADSPPRIDVMRDEMVFIHKIELKASADFWLEYHSCIESRLISETVAAETLFSFNTVTRHKGSIYFSQSSAFNYTVSYVTLKIIK